MKKLFAILLALVLVATLAGSALARPNLDTWQWVFGDGFETGDFAAWYTGPFTASRGVIVVYENSRCPIIDPLGSGYCAVATVLEDVSGQAYVRDVHPESIMSAYNVNWHSWVQTTATVAVPGIILRVKNPANTQTQFDIQVGLQNGDTKARIRCRDAGYGMRNGPWLTVPDSYGDDAMALFDVLWYRGEKGSGGGCHLRMMDFITGASVESWVDAKTSTVNLGYLDLGVIKQGGGSTSLTQLWIDTVVAYGFMP